MDFAALCQQLNLGELLAAPTPLTGGLMHKMYRLDTTHGCYALKLLNPHVMARPDALGNFRAAEELERKLEQTVVPILPALTIQGRKMQEWEGQYFYLFPYFRGAPLTEGDITPHHCAQVGRHLAAIHGVEQRQERVEISPIAIDWAALWAEVTAQNAAPAFRAEDVATLTELQHRANRAAAQIPPPVTICHNDMDPKNILWQGDQCRIIDLECLGYGNPHLELLELALCWAGYETRDPDPIRLTALVEAYARHGGDLPTCWDTLYDANGGRLEWLAYNLRRALGDEGDGHRELGRTEVGKTLDCLRRYHRIRDDVLRCLSSL